MYPFPKTPTADDVGNEVSGHVWIQEVVTGKPIRFQVQSSGLVRFGNQREVFEHGSIPLWLESATRNVRDRLELGILRDVVDDVEDVTFYGTATLNLGTSYDWSRLPGFLGVDVHKGDGAGGGGFSSPDDVEKIFGSLGLWTLPPVEKEKRSRHTDFTECYSDGLPESRYRDGEVAGVLVRDKSGGRIETRRNEAWKRGSQEILDGKDGVEEFVSGNQVLDEIMENLVEDPSDGSSLDEVLEPVLGEFIRRNYVYLYREEEPVVDRRSLRSAVAETLSRRLG
ncbi:MAG: hypothetical protein ABEK59_04200 [Halobacteria archaeon]